MSNGDTSNGGWAGRKFGRWGYDSLGQPTVCRDDQRRNMDQRQQLPATVGQPASTSGGAIALPALIRDAGGAARFGFEEFLHGQIRNPSTRKAYLHTIRLFSAWCAAAGLDLIRVTPADVARFLDGLPVALPTRKLHLSALRRFFDTLVLRHVVILNPALSVRTERYQVIEGKTPEITVDHARRLLRSLDVSHAVGRRDYVLIAILIYTAARVGAVAKLRRRDFYEVGDQFCLRFHEKGGKVREIPARHDLQQAMNEYLDRSELRYADPQSPLFRTAVRKTKRLGSQKVTRSTRPCVKTSRDRHACWGRLVTPPTRRVASRPSSYPQPLVDAG